MEISLSVPFWLSGLQLLPFFLCKKSGGQRKQGRMSVRAAAAHVQAARTQSSLSRLPSAVFLPDMFQSAFLFCIIAFVCANKYNP